MIVDESQSLEYRRIADTYKSVCFIGVENPLTYIYTGDGFKLPLFFNIDSKTAYMSGVLSAINTITLQSTTVSCISTNTGTVDNYTSSDAANNYKRVCGNQTVEGVDVENGSAIINQKTVINQFDDVVYEYGLSALYFDVDKKCSSKDNTLIIKIDTPITILFAFQAKVLATLTDGKYTAELNVTGPSLNSADELNVTEPSLNSADVVASSIYITLEQWFEKTGDNKISRRCQGVYNGDFLGGNKINATFIGKIKCNTAGNYVIKISDNNATIISDSIMILGR